jgi:hypothetical protein
MFNFGQNPLQDLAMKCLMVAGGFAAGYVFSMIAAVGFDKMVTHGKSPAVLHKIARNLGGLIVAVVVALIVFRTGGGGGTGDGTGPNSGQTTGTGTTAGSGEQTKPTDPVKPNPLADVEPVRVKVLAGDEVEKGSERFYLLGDQAAKVDRAGVTAAVAERKRAAKGPVVVVYEFGREAGPRTIAFTELKMDVEQLGVQVLSADQFRDLTRPK